MSWIRDNTSNWFLRLAIKILKAGYIPKHVAFIMDGNRRYASKNGIEKIEGHTKGDKIKKHGLCVRIIGNFSLLPKNLQELIAETMIITKEHKKGFLNIAFAYTSRDEITHAIKDVIEGVQCGDILSEDIDEELVSNCLYTNNSKNPDLLIRTSGEVRFSDFLMWQISNTCIYFSNVLWPEFNLWEFLNAIFYYQRCYSDIQKIIKIQNMKPIIQNSRQLTYIDKLHHKRQIALQRICLSNF
ncbi:dehydrodolichyl diphosphate synthase complex subunit DHDDS isoform X3 [Apis florea]|uniref:dehydrodolichyl diphosphate synthase complex subunit DHDDS isoform X3 n=1 Tax=Apis florea TaxID=7463 RepID=UPI000629534A|nr:dehydrodolichyl diphosphate synthase complex subunit DHDDS isoform X3 [Apis florea]